MKNIGFIGLGNVGGKLAASLLRNDFDLAIFDISTECQNKFRDLGASVCSSPAEVTRASELIITCLPSPAISAQVLEADDGILSAFIEGKVWCEMSTTDEAEVKRLGKKVEDRGGFAVDCPVSGGCHRATTGNISIFVGCEREAFDRIFPVLSAMGRRILHTGELGSASILKVVTNYLATANLLSLRDCESIQDDLLKLGFHVLFVISFLRLVSRQKIFFQNSPICPSGVLHLLESPCRIHPVFPFMGMFFIFSNKDA